MLLFVYVINYYQSICAGMPGNFEVLNAVDKNNQKRAGKQFTIQGSGKIVNITVSTLT
jgi:hypothetical protein